MFYHKNKAYIFCLPYMMQPAPANQKIGSGSTLKVAAPGGSGSATLVKRDNGGAKREKKEPRRRPRMETRGERKRQEGGDKRVMKKTRGIIKDSRGIMKDYEGDTNGD